MSTLSVLLLVLCACTTAAERANACTLPADLRVANQPLNLQLSGPPNASATTEWAKELQEYRSRCLGWLQLDGKVFETLKWARTAYMQPLMMPFDLAFYSNGTYTVDSYLSTLTAVYGGIDSVLLWPTYTKYGPALCCAARTCAVPMVCCAVLC